MSSFLPSFCAEAISIARPLPRALARHVRRTDKRPISSTSRLFRPDDIELSSSRGESSRSGRVSRVDIPSTPNLPAGVSEGTPRFLGKSSMETIDLVQGDLWRKLQAEIRNQPLLQQWWLEHGNRFDIASLITKTAQEPSLSLAYNYACLILNNSFFLEGLSAEPGDRVQSQHKELEAQLVARAMGMTGSGWLWIVQPGGKPSATPNLQVLPTYGSGTLLVRHGIQVGRQSGTSLYRPASPEAGDSEAPEQEIIGARATGHDVASSLKPVACVSLFEHAYLPTFGVLGKEQYVRAWFRSLNWDTLKL